MIKERDNKMCTLFYTPEKRHNGKLKPTNGTPTETKREGPRREE